MAGSDTNVSRRVRPIVSGLKISATFAKALILAMSELRMIDYVQNLCFIHHPDCDGSSFGSGCVWSPSGWSAAGHHLSPHNQRDSG